ncbi:hypothetical protein ENUP19_0146G0034 [Entamoeba nuttalli]|uniref:Uncharacterized protein n=2 Tax=Entamoeba nuttalli TaxID=412467 RepID=K2G6S1_ENTNP|nr:hypothetical protein ENU1_177390 [Entamoeba nuttalli P19]EKE38071.1 hypothetical protein ENU1_177390 [Entamoeba nuttalli P19]|eukprot:XP_008859593.1 hypothetical protein ENU1_177390 [Entamoeba nuttalli P19]
MSSNKYAIAKHTKIADKIYVDHVVKKDEIDKILDDMFDFDEVDFDINSSTSSEAIEEKQQLSCSFTQLSL